MMAWELAIPADEEELTADECDVVCEDASGARLVLDSSVLSNRAPGVGPAGLRHSPSVHVCPNRQSAALSHGDDGGGQPVSAKPATNTSAQVARNRCMHSSHQPSTKAEIMSAALPTASTSAPSIPMPNTPHPP